MDEVAYFVALMAVCRVGRLSEPFDVQTYRLTCWTAVSGT